MNCDSRDCKNIVNIVGISSDNIAYEQYFEWLVQGWIMIHVNSVGSITPPKFPSVNLNVWIVEKSYVVWGAHIK